MIAEANKNVQKATQSTAGGLYKKYSTLLCMWSEIGTSVSQYSAAARFKVQFKELDYLQFNTSLSKLFNELTLFIAEAVYM